MKIISKKQNLLKYGKVKEHSNKHRPQNIWFSVLSYPDITYKTIIYFLLFLQAVTRWKLIIYDQ